MPNADKPRLRREAHLERGARGGLREGVRQQEYVVHADAQGQEGQHLEGHREGSWRNEGPELWAPCLPRSPAVPGSWQH